MVMTAKSYPVQRHVPVTPVTVSMEAPPPTNLIASGLTALILPDPPGIAKSAKNCKMVMLRNGFFGKYLFKMISSGTNIQGLKWGSFVRHIPNTMHTYGITPSPPPPPHRT